MTTKSGAASRPAQYAFTPMHDFWPRFNPDKSAEIPYTFVETPSGRVNNLYGAYLAYRKNLTDDAEGRDSLAPDDRLP